jgi:hypothetical protein
VITVRLCGVSCVWIVGLGLWVETAAASLGTGKSVFQTPIQAGRTVSHPTAVKGGSRGSGALRLIS